MWKQNRTGKFALLKSYPICKFSGKLGPKITKVHIVLTSAHQIYYVLMYEDYTDTR